MRPFQPFAFELDAVNHWKELVKSDKPLQIQAMELRQRLKRAYLSYCVALPLALVLTIIVGWASGASAHPLIAAPWAIAWIVCTVWLASMTSTAAELTSPAVNVWLVGVLLFPVGALVLPLVQLRRLRLLSQRHGA